MKSSEMLLKINHLINEGLSAYHIQQVLKADGHKTYCFGSYYTTGKPGKNRVCFYETDKGVKAQHVNYTEE